MERKTKPYKSQLALLEKVKHHGGIIVERHSGMYDHYFLRNGPEIVHEKFERLLKRGLIIPNNDGLFGTSQSYRVADGF